MNQIAVSFTAFMYDGMRSVKQPLVMARNVILPTSHEGVANFTTRVSKEDPCSALYLSEFLVPLEEIIGKDAYRHWLGKYMRWHDVNETAEKSAVMRGMNMNGLIGMARMKPFQGIHAIYYSNELYREFHVPAFGSPWEVEMIERSFKSVVSSKESSRIITCVAHMPSPDLAEVSWEEIADLRNSRSYQAFFEKVEQRGAHGTAGPCTMQTADLKEHLDHICRFKPELPLSCLKAIFCELPFNPLCPFETEVLASGVSEGGRLGTRYGYMMFVLDPKDGLNGEEPRFVLH